MVPNREQVEQESLSYEELQIQHQSHEKRLQELHQKAWMTPEEEMEATVPAWKGAVEVSSSARGPVTRAGRVPAKETSVVDEAGSTVWVSNSMSSRALDCTRMPVARSTS